MFLVFMNIREKEVSVYFNCIKWWTILRDLPSYPFPKHTDDYFDHCIADLGIFEAQGNIVASNNENKKSLAQTKHFMCFLSLQLSKMMHNKLYFQLRHWVISSVFGPWSGLLIIVHLKFISCGHKQTERIKF